MRRLNGTEAHELGRRKRVPHTVRQLRRLALCSCKRPPPFHLIMGCFVTVPLHSPFSLVLPVQGGLSIGLEIGIIGLPNVGKSNSVQTLTRLDVPWRPTIRSVQSSPIAAVSQYPMKGSLRSQRLSSRNSNPYATIEFVDIAGPSCRSKPR